MTWHKGEVFVQADLAKTLQRIQSQGRAGFYEGETARLLSEEMVRGKGLITEEDLKNYHATWREPIQAKYKEYNVITMPPTSSGGVALLQMMRLTEQYPLRKWG